MTARTDTGSPSLISPVFALAPGEGYRVADVRIEVTERRR